MLTESKNCLVRQATKVTISWNKTENWSDICIWAIDQFGLPGNKYMWHAKSDFMEFVFTDEKDAKHMILRWS